MNLILNCDWPVPEPDRIWLEGEVRRLLREAAVVMRYPYPNMPADPVEAFTGTLRMYLYIGNQTPWGSAGNYVRDGSKPWGFGNPFVDAAIHVSWYWHYTRGHRVIQFEGRNFWNDMLTGRGSFAHPLDGCPLIDWMKRELIEPTYRTDTDNPMPDVRLRHVSNLNVDL